MNIFDVFIVQPIFNALLFLYEYTANFGISIIIFTIFVRLALWPLLKKQLHQTRLMRQIQPELKKIKQKTKGNRQLEGQMMMELYREKGIKPFSSIFILLIQLPIFIGIYQVINVISNHQDQIARHLYNFVKELPRVSETLAASGKHFNEQFLGLFDLTQAAISPKGFSITLALLALVAGIVQYVQTKQLLPKSGEQKKLRDILREASQGKQADQSDISTAMGNQMAVLMPIMLTGISLYLPGAVVLYYAMSSFVAVIQQHLALKQDEEEMIDLVEKPAKQREKRGKNGTVVRIKTAKEAQLVAKPRKQKRRKKGSR
jgi:YidC/Oxa1 family membrane protein insertase